MVAPLAQQPPQSSVPVADLRSGRPTTEWWRWFHQIFQILSVGGQEFNTLPASPTLGMEAIVTDSNTNVMGDVIAGGGGFIVKAWFNNTNWTVTGI